MARAEEKKYCPLLNQEITRMICYEVGEVRDDNMDMEIFALDSFDIEEANEKCEKCKWYMTIIE
ncbi:hypothetical protein [Terrisporobacter glycolicus]|uniref:Uncharacterized protein n=1 Tax=Terrisporobacter glycolicus ATCC 14880 = DSM 1288 TaxID=1121315 RepID=A0ABZ2EX78_9FIRM|nr:hypothetical protein [Terrisporobacter glycolicus]